jgi:hypothetical protein
VERGVTVVQRGGVHVLWVVVLLCWLSSSWLWHRLARKRSTERRRRLLV